MGLSFSINPGTKKLPPSLNNIFKELSQDLGTTQRTDGDLTSWCEQGVVLLNRSLSYDPEIKKVDLRWVSFTDEVARILGERKTVALLWGASAQQLSRYFDPHLTISSVHPSPLSAYKGFLGSRPFSGANELLAERGMKAIDWNK
jgi:uracil-DNA glycosylase